MSNNESYSRSEWSSLSIQERIRAMNQTLAKEEPEPEPAPDHASLHTSPSTEASSPEQAAPPVESSSDPPKRASVVDIWRKRETSSGGTKNEGEESPAVPKRTWKPPPAPASAAGAPAVVPATPAPSTDESATVGEEEPPQKTVSSVAELFKQRNGNEAKPPLSSSSPKKVEGSDPGVDLTIVPATEEEEEELDKEKQKSGRGKVSDIWKHATSTPTHGISHPENDAAEVIPKRSRVVDIWTQRTPGKQSQTEEKAQEVESFVPWPTEDESADNHAEAETVPEEPQVAAKAFLPKPFGRTYPSPTGSAVKSSPADDKKELVVLPADEETLPATAPPSKRSVADIWTKRSQAADAGDDDRTSRSPPLPKVPSKSGRGSVVDRYTKQLSAPNSPAGNGTLEPLTPSTPTSGGTTSGEKKQLTPRSFARIAPEAVGEQFHESEGAKPSTGSPKASARPSWMVKAAAKGAPVSASKFPAVAPDSANKRTPGLEATSSSTIPVPTSAQSSQTIKATAKGFPVPASSFSSIANKSNPDIEKGAALAAIPPIASTRSSWEKLPAASTDEKKATHDASAQPLSGTSAPSWTKRAAAKGNYVQTSKTPSSPNSQPSWMSKKLRSTPPKTPETVNGNAPSWKKTPSPSPSVPSFESSNGPSMPLEIIGSNPSNVKPPADTDRSRHSESSNAFPSANESVGDGPSSSRSVMSGTSLHSQSSILSGRRAKAFEIAVKIKKPKNKSWKYAFPESANGSQASSTEFRSGRSASGSKALAVANSPPRNLPKPTNGHPNLPTKPVTQWTLKDVMKENKLKSAQSYSVSLSGSQSQDSELAKKISIEESSFGASAATHQTEKINNGGPSTPVRLGASSLSSLVEQEKRTAIDEAGRKGSVKGGGSVTKPPTPVLTPDTKIRRLAPSNRDTVTNAELLEHEDEPGRLKVKSPGAILSEERRRFLQERRAQHQRDLSSGSATVDRLEQKRVTEKSTKGASHARAQSFDVPPDSFSSKAAVGKEEKRSKAEKACIKGEKLAKSGKIAGKSTTKQTKPTMSVDTQPKERALSPSSASPGASPFAASRYHHQQLLNSRSPKFQELAEKDAGSEISAGSSNFSNTFSVFSINSCAVDSSVVSPTSSLASRATRVLRERRKRMEEQEGFEKDIPQSLHSKPVDHKSKSEVPDVASSKKAAVSKSDKAASSHNGQKAARPDTQPPRHDPLMTRESRINRISNAERRTEPRLMNRYSDAARFLETSPENSNQRSLTFDSETTEGSSQIPSAEASTSDVSDRWIPDRARSSQTSILRARSESTDLSSKDGGKQAAVTQGFVDESSTNLKAFREAYKTMSFQQLARDLKEEVSTVANNFNFRKIATDFNQSSKAACDNLRGKLSGDAGKDISLPVPAQADSVDEGVAIEVEYVTDDGESTVQTEDEDAILDHEFDALLQKRGQDLFFSANGNSLHEC